MSFDIVDYAAEAIELLEKSNFEAYLVGGCVRDMLLNISPKDWDIATSATPEETERVFAQYKTLDIGKAHGTVTVVHPLGNLEITTYRTDGDYFDSRHPSSVTFTTDISKDLARRDFTINAMAYNPNSGLVDLYGGQKDASDGIIRCVGEPAQRFSEDALRIMRCARFAAQLGFSVDSSTLCAVAELSKTLADISAERITSELEKILLSPHPDMALIDCAQLLTGLFPAISAQNRDYSHLCAAISALPLHLPLRLAAFAAAYSHCTQGQPLLAFAELLKHLRLAKAPGTQCMGILQAFAEPLPKNKIQLKLLLRDYTAELYLYCLYLHSISEPTSTAPTAIAAMTMETMADGDCFSYETLAVKGSDLITAGVLQGEKLGRILEALLTAVIEEKLPNEKSSLLEAAKLLDEA